MVKEEKLKNDNENSSLEWMKKVRKAFQNQTFLYILRRTLSALLTLFLLVIVVICLIRLIPDSYFYNIKDYKEQIRKNGQLAADCWKGMMLYQYGRTDIKGNYKPLIVSIAQYIYWILPIYKKVPLAYNLTYTEVIKYWEGFIYFGRSMQSGNYVIDDLTSKMGISFTISIITVILTYLFALPLGVAMAKKPGGVVDKIANVFIVLNYAIPGLVFYLVMWSVFGDANGLFGQAFGYYYDSARFWTLVPPIFCMVFLGIPGVCIWVRRYMVDELSSDYVKFARSKGLSENKIMYTHVLRNACIPLVRSIPSTLLGAFVGSYYIEVIWHIPGTGGLLINALQVYDIPVIQSLTFIYAAISMLSFLLGDIITVFFDPRIKLTK